MQIKQQRDIVTTAVHLVVVLNTFKKVVDIVSNPSAEPFGNLFLSPEKQTFYATVMAT